MNGEVQGLLRLIGQSFVDPAGVATLLNAVRLNRGILWSALLLVVCLSVLIMHLALTVFPMPEDHPLALFTPFTLALVLGSWLTVLVFAFYFTGQAFGGTGRFPGALLLVTWWQVMTMAVQVVQIIVELILPALSGIVSLMGVGYLFFALVQFVNVLHGFQSGAKALGVVLVALVGLIFGLAFVLALIGVSAQGGMTHV